MSEVHVERKSVRNPKSSRDRETDGRPRKRFNYVPHGHFLVPASDRRSSDGHPSVVHSASVMLDNGRHGGDRGHPDSQVSHVTLQCQSLSFGHGRRQKILLLYGCGGSLSIGVEVFRKTFSTVKVLVSPRPSSGSNLGVAQERERKREREGGVFCV